MTESKGSPVRLIVSLLVAICLVGGIFYSYLYLRTRHAAAVPSAPQLTGQQINSKPKIAPQAQIAQNETRVKNGQALISGTVRNISPDNLSELRIELELKARADGHTENRTLTVNPKNVDAGQEGTFSLQVPSRDYMGLRILSLRRGGEKAEVAFISVPGTARPLEKPSQSKTIIVERPTQRRTGEEFLNTPDNPERIR
ncbi:MAG: hypothetical protein ABR577_06575 [Pyrinomonadaceae bacterium]